MRIRSGSMLVPIIGIVALPALVACVLVLVYAVPCMAYLLLAQTDPPAHVRGLFLPLNPVRNIGLTIAVLKYLNTVARIFPRFVYHTARYVLWNSISTKLGEAANRRNIMVDGGKVDPEGGIKLKGILREPRIDDPGAERTNSGKGPGYDSLESTMGKIKRSSEQAQTERIKWVARSRTGGLFEDFANFNVPYHTRQNGSKVYLDVYLPPLPPMSSPSSPPIRCVSDETKTQSRRVWEHPSTGVDNNAPSYGRAPDTDVDRSDGQGSTHTISTEQSTDTNDSTATLRQEDTTTPSEGLLPNNAGPVGASTLLLLYRATTSENASPTESGLSAESRPIDSLSKVIIFVYDTGVIGPKWLRPRKEYFGLLGSKLAEMGYVVVIPNISLYPDGGLEDSVADLRRVLAWTRRNIHRYGGSTRSTYLMGHGLGGHLALYTISQEVIVRSRNEYIQDLHEAYRSYRATSTATFGRSAVHRSGGGLDRSESADSLLSRRGSSPYSSGSDKNVDDARGEREQTFDYTQDGHFEVLQEGVEGYAQLIPNGLRGLEVYGSDIEIPNVKGLILLSPVSDIIKQIRYESTQWLEHLSPLRRSHGPSQISCMRHSVGHLLFASKAFLNVQMMPKVLIIHGAQNTTVPLDSSHWLSELLYGLDVPVIFRPYRNLGHWDLLMGFMKGFEDTVSSGTNASGQREERDDPSAKADTTRLKKTDQKGKCKESEKKFHAHGSEGGGNQNKTNVATMNDWEKLLSPESENWSWRRTGYTAWLERDLRSFIDQD
ncbi:hypothetical protein IAT40_001269 [Kwoniella sp. CBS 6097]